MTEEPESCVVSAGRFKAQLLSASKFRTPDKYSQISEVPKNRRSVARTQSHDHYSYESLINKTWRVYSLSPLYNFRTDHVSLSRYSRSLDTAFSKEMSDSLNNSMKSSFSLYKGLDFHESDAPAVKIEVMEKNNTGPGDHKVLTAFMMCVDLSCSPVLDSLASHFTYYPVVLTTGTKTRAAIFLSWLECHFDCRSHVVEFSDNDLRWMLATSSSQMKSLRTQPVLLQFSVPHICDGIDTINCKFESSFCKDLWERLCSNGSNREEINEEEVNRFVDALVKHLEYTMPVLFSKLQLSEVGTSVMYISSEGKLKLFSCSSIFLALHLICEIVSERFLEVAPVKL